MLMVQNHNKLILAAILITELQVLSKMESSDLHFSH